MSKTPEEMAMEYIRDVETARNPSVAATAFPQMRRCFLAGYKAAMNENKPKVQELEANWKFCCEDKARLLNELAAAERAKEQVADVSKVMPQWISVKDRLPEENEEVLVFGNILNAPKLLGVRYRVLGDQDWKYSWQGDGFIFKQDYVTHWMELPAPPKEEK